MARNCEKHFVGLNRVLLEDHWKKEKAKQRPKLAALQTASDVKKWIPSIKREMDYCLQQLSGARKHEYSTDKIKEFQERVASLEREHKRFVQKVRQLDPETVGIPWENRAYTSKRKSKAGSASHSPTKKSFIATPILSAETEDNDDSPGPFNTET